MIKQVIVLRKDLNMRKGKMVAQGAHASMGAILGEGYIEKPEIGLPLNVIPMNTEMVKWLEGSFTKICVSVDSEEQLLDIYNFAKIMGLPSALIEDCGRTEFGGISTYTAVAIGPANSEEIDKITGDLKLL